MLRALVSTSAVRPLCSFPKARLLGPLISKRAIQRYPSEDDDPNVTQLKAGLRGKGAFGYKRPLQWEEIEETTPEDDFEKHLEDLEEAVKTTKFYQERGAKGPQQSAKEDLSSFDDLYDEEFLVNEETAYVPGPDEFEVKTRQKMDRAIHVEAAIGDGIDYVKQVDDDDKGLGQPKGYIIPTKRRRAVTEDGTSLSNGRRKTAVANIILTPVLNNLIPSEMERSTIYTPNQFDDTKPELYEIGPDALSPAVSCITINGKSLVEYFPPSYRATVLHPFLVTDTLGLFQVKVRVKGSGLSAQSESVRQGISVALEKYDPDFRAVLKAARFIQRDIRKVERKKPGKVKARKSTQWVKR